jgi:hypothetical protein
MEPTGSTFRFKWTETNAIIYTDLRDSAPYTFDSFGAPGVLTTQDSPQVIDSTGNLTAWQQPRSRPACQLALDWMSRIPSICQQRNRIDWSRI